MIDIVSQALLWLGAFTALLGSIGLMRFPDFYTRSHAATMIGVGGFTLSLAGIALLYPATALKVILILLVNFLTNPTATHALADAAYDLGISPVRLARDELKHSRQHESQGGQL